MSQEIKGTKSLLSVLYMLIHKPIWWRLFAQPIRNARSLALLKAGSSSAARIAMIAITTNSSISVNAPLAGRVPTTRPRLAVGRT